MGDSRYVSGLCPTWHGDALSGQFWYVGFLVIKGLLFEIYRWLTKMSLKSTVLDGCFPDFKRPVNPWVLFVQNQTIFSPISLEFFCSCLGSTSDRLADSILQVEQFNTNLLPIFRRSKPSSTRPPRTRPLSDKTNKHTSWLKVRIFYFVTIVECWLSGYDSELV